MTYIPDESKVVYKSKDAKEEKTFDALEWLAAMASHVPNGDHALSSYSSWHLSGISAVHRSKEMIETSEKRFRDLVENSLTGISIIQDDQIVYQNREQERLFGRLPRSSKLEDFESIHPGDIEKVQDFNQRITSGEVQILDTDFRFYVRDTIDNGVDVKWAYCRAALTEYQGKIKTSYIFVSFFK